MCRLRSAASSERPVPDVARTSTRYAFSENERRRQRRCCSSRAACCNDGRRCRAEGTRDRASPKVRASTWSRRSGARWSTSWRSIRASSCSARTSVARAACMPRRWACRRSSAPRACSIRACRKRASSAAPSAWRSPGLMPVPEIQFRKYADPAVEQLNDCGTMRWRTANRFAAPMVVRMPGGFFKCGDPWHSQTQRSAVRARDRLARRDAVERRGCGRPVAQRDARQRSDDLLRASRDARRCVGAPSVSRRRVRRSVRQGARCCVQASELTVVTLGRDGRALRAGGATSRSVDVEVLDLRTLMPWDREAVLASVRKTRRCLIVHEDKLTAGFGAEIAAVLAQRSILRPRRADRARHDAGHSEPAQSAAARGGRAERRAHRARHPQHRQRLSERRHDHDR